MLYVITPDGIEYKVKYTHSFNKDGSVYTIAFITDKNQRVLAKGVAHCSNKDTFSKKKGRIIATGRLYKDMGLPRTGLYYGKV